MSGSFQPQTIPLLSLSRNPIVAFAQGVGLPFRGAGFLLSRPHLWSLVAIPLAINTILFCAVLFFGWSWFAEHLRAWITTPQPEAAWYIRFGLGALAFMAKLFFWLVVLLLVYLVFTPMALIIAAPFNDRLAEHAERACGFVVEDERHTIGKVVGEALYVLVGECKRLAAFGLVFLLIFLLNVIPVLGNALYPPIVFVWGCVSAAFEFASYPADRRHFPFRRKWAMVRCHPAFSLGFGCVTVLCLMIPFLNVLIVPVSAVAGTFLFCMVHERDLDARAFTIRRRG
jgi:CysZ protein